MTTKSASVAAIGRDEEVAAVGAFLDTVATGPAALLLEGDAGIGKTTIWRAGVEAARRRSFAVLSCRASESESALSFVALADLLDGIPEEAFASLPAPQRQALEVALLRAHDDRKVDRLALARGVLTILRFTSSASPMLLAVDDVQWLDAPSADALRFLFRRLGEEPIGLLGSIRAEDAVLPLELNRALPSERLTRVVLRPFPFAELERVVSAHCDLRFTRPTWRAIHRTSGGNPFFALQLVDALSARGELAPGEEPPLPETLSGTLRERFGALGPRGQGALLAIAALAQPTTSLVRAGAADSAGVAEAVAAGILELDGVRLRFTHPLLRSFVYTEASSRARTRVHRRLAELVEDAEERALHLGRGSDEPDERVAAELEAAAERAALRGHQETAAELAERAETLTPTEGHDEAARRATAAGLFWNAAGDAVRARRIFDRLVESLPRGRSRARVLGRLGFIFADVGALARALEETEDDVKHLSVLHTDLSSVELVRHGDFAASVANAQTAVELAEASGDAATLAKALAAFAACEVHTSPRLALALIDRAVELERSLRDPLPISDRPATKRGLVLLAIDSLDEARDELEEAYQQGLALGHVYRSAVLTRLAELECRAGNWQRALAHAVEAEEIGRQWGLPGMEAFTLCGRALVEAHLGNVEHARAAGARSSALARREEHHAIAVRAEVALGFLELSLGDFAAALNRLSAPTGQPGVAPPRAGPDDRWLTDAVESLVGLGRLREAEQVLTWAQRRADALGLPSRLAAAARCRALVLAEQGDVTAARAAISDALGTHAQHREPFELGRTLLVAGSVERRAKRKAGAREALERACEIFGGLGARLWHDKARLELERTGLRRVVGTQLTATERQVAELAARGATNKQIAGSLFMSVKTVEANLSRIYRKLDVRSRTELAVRIAKPS